MKIFILIFFLTSCSSNYTLETKVLTQKKTKRPGKIILSTLSSNFYNEVQKIEFNYELKNTLMEYAEGHNYNYAFNEIDNIKMIDNYPKFIKASNEHVLIIFVKYHIRIKELTSRQEEIAIQPTPEEIEYAKLSNTTPYIRHEFVYKAVEIFKTKITLQAFDMKQNTLVWEGDFIFKKEHNYIGHDLIGAEIASRIIIILDEMFSR